MLAGMLQHQVKLASDNSVLPLEPEATDVYLPHSAGAATASYAFLYPNLMLNRYGPWLDLNIVEPTGPQTCQVRFEYFLDQDFRADAGYVEESLQASDEVQQEDVKLCEAVQRGLRSPAYGTGRSVQLLSNTKSASGVALQMFSLLWTGYRCYLLLGIDVWLSFWC